MRGIHDAQNAMVRFGASMKSIGRSMMLMGATILGPMFGVSRSVSKYADEIIKGARITGIGTGAMQELRFGAEQCNVAFDSLVVGIERMDRYIGSLSEMNLENNKSMWRLGLTLRDIKAMRPEEQFALLADRIMSMGTVAERERIGVEIFGRNFREIVPFLVQGSKGLREFNAMAQRTGIVLSERNLNAARGFGIEMRELWASVKGTSMALGGELLPVMSGVARTLIDGIQSSRAWIREHGSLIRNVLIGAGALFGFGAAVWTAGRLVTVAGLAFYGFRKTISGLGVVLDLAFRPVRFLLSPMIGLISRLTNVTWMYHAAVYALGRAKAVLGAVWFFNVTVAKAWHSAVLAVKNVIFGGLLKPVFALAGVFATLAFNAYLAASRISGLLVGSFVLCGKTIYASALPAVRSLATGLFRLGRSALILFANIGIAAVPLIMKIGGLAALMFVPIQMFLGGFLIGVVNRSFTMILAIMRGAGASVFKIISGVWVGGVGELFRGIVANIKNLGTVAATTWKIVATDVGSSIRQILSSLRELSIASLKAFGKGALNFVTGLAAALPSLVRNLGILWAVWSAGAVIVTTVGGLISAAVASVVVFVKEMTRAFSASWASIKAGIPGLMNAFSGFGSFFSSWGKTLGGVLDSIGQRFGKMYDDWKGAFEGIQNAIAASRWDTVWQILTLSFKLTIMELRNIVAENWPNIVSSITQSFAGILGGFLILKDYATLQFENIWDSFTTGASNAWQFMADSFMAVLTPLGAMLEGFFESMFKKFNMMTFGVSGKIGMDMAGTGSALSGAISSGLAAARGAHSLRENQSWGRINPATGKREGGKVAGDAAGRQKEFDEKSAAGTRKKEAEDRAKMWETRLIGMQDIIGVPKEALDDIRAEIDNARKDAKKAADAIAAARELKGDKKDFPLGGEELTKMSMKQVGGFTGAVGRNVMTGGPMERVAANTGQANKHLEGILRAVNRGSLNGRSNRPRSDRMFPEEFVID